MERLEICKACEHFTDKGNCRVIQSMFPGFFKPMRRIVEKPTAGCPEKKWLPIVFDCPNCGESQPGATCKCGHDYYRALEDSRVEYNEPSTAQPIGGPGAELEKLIPKMFKSKTCSCRSYARKMDRWGIDGCTERFDQIVAHLVLQAKKKAILKHLGLITKIQARHWVSKAIENAQARQSPVVIRPKEGFPIEKDEDWYVAITTAPRNDCTLLQCIQSIRQAGWEPTIFAEPGSTTSNAETIWNNERKGCWHNWLASANYALENSSAGKILTVQDDMVFHPETRTFAESILWPSESAGFVSLYTPKHYSFSNKAMRPIGINRIHTRSLWGACALVWPRDVLVQVVSHPIAQQWIGVRPRSGSPEVIHRRRDNPSLIANSDTAIGRVLNKMGRTMWFIDPSPCSHAAEHSTIGHGGNGGRRNCYRCADHDMPLREQVYAKVPE